MNLDDEKIKVRIPYPTLQQFWLFQELKRRYWYRLSRANLEEPCEFWDVHFTSEEDKAYFLKVIEFIQQNPIPKQL